MPAPEMDTDLMDDIDPGFGEVGMPPPLENAGPISLITNPSGGNDRSEDYLTAYSTLLRKIVFDQAEGDFTYWAGMYLPDEPQHKTLVEGLIGLGLREFRYAIAHRKALIKGAKEEQANWLKEARANAKDPEETERQIERMETLFAHLSKARQIQTSIRRQEWRYGFNVIEHRCPEWLTAEKREQQAEEKAARELSEAVFMVFINRRIELLIIESIEDDEAQGLEIRDYSDLIENISKGNASQSQVDIEGPVYLSMARTHCQMFQGENNARHKFIESIYTGIPHQRPVHPQKQGFFRRRNNAGQYPDTGHPPQQGGNY